MHIQDILSRGEPSLSFEFFPARTPPAAAKLQETLAQLTSLAPDFVSVTYGAGGSTRELTYDLIAHLRQSLGWDALPHITCVGHTRAEIERLLERYAQLGVSNVLALRGDPPRDGTSATGDFTRAIDLVQAIRSFGRHPCPRGFGIGVAGFPEGHPATPNRLREMDHLKAKVDAGADYICTQLFFDNRDFYDFRERCELAGIHVPILAGIIPLTSLASMERVAELAAGARFPARLLRALQAAGTTPAAVEEAGLSYGVEQCADLLAQSVAGLHFYTLNSAAPVLRIYRALGLSPHAHKAMQPEFHAPPC